ncbi:MAG: hypothetical protein [Circular genetic element sp.]|nr:MAG: hypothetical protein [Circular genetic element sp.]
MSNEAHMFCMWNIGIYSKRAVCRSSMSSRVSQKGGRRMKRRTKTKFTQIHVSIPVRVLEDLDDTLDFNQSRSKIITRLIQNALEGDQVNIGSMTKKQIVINLMNQTDSNTAEYVMLQTLLQIFS